MAGKRKGLAGERSGLWFAFRDVIAGLKPRWVIIENVPGLLSSHEGRDFALLLRGLAELGYRFASRVLDSQYLGVPQRRRRVFIVGSLGDGSCAEILFEPESVRGDSAPSRTPQEGIAGGIAGSLGGGSGKRGFCDDLDRSGAFIPEVSKTLQGEAQDASPDADGRGFQVVSAPIRTSPFCDNDGQENGLIIQAVAHAVVCHCAKGGDPTTDNYVVVPSIVSNGDAHSGFRDERGLVAIAFQESQSGCREYVDAGTLRANGLGHDPVGTRLRTAMGVRRLTPRECERLQGFTDTDFYITIEACLDPQKPSANADKTNLKSQPSVGNAERIASQSDVLFVEKDFNRSCQNDSRLVPLLVHISCVDERVQFRNPRKSPLFASGVERQNWFLPPTVPADFAPYIAHLCQSVDQAMPVGSEELLLSEQCSIHRRNGRLHAKLFGNGIMQLVRDALSDSRTKEKPTKFITEKVFNSQNLDSSIQTLFLFVAHATSGFIPEPTGTESFRIDICSRTPWTAWGIENGKRVILSDSARYRMIGNAVTVNVAKWIGRRLMTYCLNGIH